MFERTELDILAKIRPSSKLEALLHKQFQQQFVV